MDNQCESSFLKGKSTDTVAEVFKRLVDQMPLPLWIFDEALHVVYDNQTSWSFGIGQSVVGVPVDQFSPDVSQLMRREICQCLADRKARSFEGWMHSHVLGRCYMQLSFLYLPDDLIACIPLDLTATKQVEALLLTSEAKFRTLVETMQDGVWIYDRNMEIIFTNESLCRMLGYQHDELIGRSLRQLVAVDRHGELVTQLGMEIDGGYQQFEIALLTKSGQERIVNIAPAPDHDSSGNSISSFAVITDITERRVAESALRASESRYRAVVEDQTELICRFDPAGMLTFANSAYCRFFNLDAANILGKFFVPLVPEDELPLVHRMTEQISLMNPASSVEHRVILEDGTIRWLQWNAQAILDESCSCIEIQAIGRDVTERKASYQELLRYQNQLRSLTSQLSLTEDRERRRIAAGLHAEIGHSMALARLRIAELALQEGDPAKRAGLQDALDLIHQVLDTTRTLTFELSPPVHQEGGFITSLEWLIENVSEKCAIQGVFQDDCLPKPLSADMRVLLFHAARELVVNAVKHSQASIVQLAVSRVGEEVAVSVKDNGIGFSVGSITTESGTSGGYGLFSIHERINHAGGRVHVTSVPDHGTDIKLFIPVRSAARRKSDKSEAGVHERARPVVKSPKPIRVLLADDHAMVREGLRSLIQNEADLTVIAEAGDGLSAVDQALELRPDVVVMAVDLPALSGIESARRLRASNPKIKIIALTLHRDKHHVGEMLKAGVEGYLLKDCTHQNLLEAIRAVHAGWKYICQPVLDSMIEEYIEQCNLAQPVKASVLTTRELEILGALADGMSTKEVARHFGLSAKTVETHRRRILDKLNLRSVAELTKYAIREGICLLEA